MQTRKWISSVLPGKGFGAVWALGCWAGARSPCTRGWSWADCRHTFVPLPLLPHGRTRETLFHQTISTGALIHTSQWILCHLQCTASIHTLGGFAVHCSETSCGSRGPSSRLAAPSLLTASFRALEANRNSLFSSGIFHLLQRSGEADQCHQVRAARSAGPAAQPGGHGQGKQQRHRELGSRGRGRSRTCTWGKKDWASRRPGEPTDTDGRVSQRGIGRKKKVEGGV